MSLTEESSASGGYHLNEALLENTGIYPPSFLLPEIAVGSTAKMESLVAKVPLTDGVDAFSTVYRNFKRIVSEGGGLAEPFKKLVQVTEPFFGTDDPVWDDVKNTVQVTPEYLNALRQIITVVYKPYAEEVQSIEAEIKEANSLLGAARDRAFTQVALRHAQLFANSDFITILNAAAFVEHEWQQDNSSIPHVGDKKVSSSDRASNGPEVVLWQRKETSPTEH